MSTPRSVDLMYAQIHRPSASTSKSSKDTVDFLERSRSDDDRTWLVEKWRPRVTEIQERSLMQLVEDFGIDVYRTGESIPTEQYWL